MVPCPSGILAVGDGEAVDLPLFDRTRETSAGIGVVGADVGDVVVGELDATDAAGVTGFMRNPLIATGAGSGD
jgi:hypothetical protein